MAVFAPGTGGTLKSETLEDALLELVARIREEEVTAEVGQRVFLTLDTTAGTATISANLPVTLDIGVDGRPVINVTEYIGI